MIINPLFPSKTGRDRAMCCSLLGPSFILRPCCIAVIIAGWIAAASGRLRWWWWWWWHVSRRQLSRQSCHTTSFGGLCWNTCYNTPLSAIEKNWAKFVRFKNPRSQGIELFTEVFSRSFEYSTLEKEREGRGEEREVVEGRSDDEGHCLLFSTTFSVDPDTHIDSLEQAEQIVLEGTSKWSCKIAITGDTILIP